MHMFCAAHLPFMVCHAKLILPSWTYYVRLILPSWACIYVIYLHGHVMHDSFTFKDLLSLTWFFAQLIHLHEHAMYNSFTFMNIFGQIIYLHGHVMYNSFTFMGMLCTSHLHSWVCYVQLIYLHEHVIYNSFTFMNIYGQIIYLHGHVMQHSVHYLQSNIFIHIFFVQFICWHLNGTLYHPPQLSGKVINNKLGLFPNVILLVVEHATQCLKIQSLFLKCHRQEVTHCKT